LKVASVIVFSKRTDTKDANVCVAVVSCFETARYSVNICIVGYPFFFRFSLLHCGNSDTFFVVILDDVELKVTFLASLCHKLNFSASHFFH
jgi:hypothetical protein